MFRPPLTCLQHPLQVLYLKGLRYIYQFNVFLYMFLSIAGISLLWMIVRGAGGPWKRKKRGEGGGKLLLHNTLIYKMGQIRAGSQ